MREEAASQIVAIFYITILIWYECPFMFEKLMSSFLYPGACSVNVFEKT